MVCSCFQSRYPRAVDVEPTRQQPTSNPPGRVAPVEPHPRGSGAASSQNPLRGPATARHPKVSYRYSTIVLYTAVSISLVKQTDNHTKLCGAVVIKLRCVYTKRHHVRVRQRLNIVPMMTASEWLPDPVLSVKFSVTINTMLNFEGTVTLT